MEPEKILDVNNSDGNCYYSSNSSLPWLQTATNFSVEPGGHKKKVDKSGNKNINPAY